MAKSEIVQVAYEVDLTQFAQKMAEIKGFDEKQTKILIAAMKKRTNQADREAKKEIQISKRKAELQTRDAVRAQNAIIAANKAKIESFRKFGEFAQGRIGSVTGRVFVLGEAISQFVGASGWVGMAGLSVAGFAVVGVAAFAGVTLAVAGTTAAIVKLMFAAEEMHEELEPLYDLGALEVITDEQLESITAFNNNMEGITKIIKSIAVEIAANMGPQLKVVSHLLLTMGFLIGDMAKQWIQAGSLINRAIVYSLVQPLRGVIQTWEGILFLLSRNFAKMGQAIGIDFPSMADKAIDKMRGFTGLLDAVAHEKLQQGMGMLMEQVDGIGGSFAEARAKAHAMQAALSLVDAGAHEASKKIHKTKEKTKDLAKELEKFNKKVQAIMARTASVMDQFSAFGERARVSMATPIEAIQMQLVKDLDAFEGVRKKLAAQIAELELAIQEQAKRGLDPSKQQALLDDALSQLQKFESDRLAIIQASSQKVEKIREQEAQKLTQAYFGTSTAIIGATEAVGKFAAAQASQAKEGTEAQKRAAKTAFIISQSAAMSQITISTAQAVMQALASLPAPFGAIAAGAAAATGAAQLATVASAPPPKFHIGGAIGGSLAAPDEVSIRAKSGEGVLSSRGMAAIGGKEGLKMANRGQSSPGELVVVQKYQHRSFAAFSEDAVRMTNSPIRKAIKRKNRVGHR